MTNKLISLKSQLRRLSVDCHVETDDYWYAGAPSSLLKDIPEKILQLNIKEISLQSNGKYSQYLIKV